MTQAKLQSYRPALAKPAVKPAPKLAARPQSKPELRPERVLGAQRREAILAVARDVFLEAGYEGASMSQIAARLGGSKGTLYSYFDSKQALFEALIVETCAARGDAIFDIAAGLALPQTLHSIACAYIRLVMSDDAVRMFQIIAAEARRWPALGALFYESGPAAAITRLSRQLAEHGAGAGLAIDNDVAAAETFLTLCRGSLHMRRILGLAPTPDAATLDEQAARAVAAFRRLYAGPAV